MLKGRHASLVAALALLTGRCGASDEEGTADKGGLALPKGLACQPQARDGVDPAAGVSFDVGHMLCVAVEMDEGDYAALSDDTTFGVPVADAWASFYGQVGDCTVGWPKDYTWFKAKVRVDGVELDDVGIRKKGFLGSAVTLNYPSLKLKTDKYVDGQLLGDTERLTLNNRGKDATHVLTCLAFEIFGAADYPAPRCNLANVSVNGVPQGTYAHVESVKKRFLQRAFGDSGGALYEATLGDFLDDGMARWEAKTDDTDAELAPIKGIVEALKKPDAELVDALSPLVNIDRFVTFWALEILLSHGDGYTSKQNNFFVYFDPQDGGRATVIPWSLDSALSLSYQNDALDDWTVGELARRLSRIPAVTDKLSAELVRLIDTVWDQAALLASVDRYHAQVLTAQRSNEALEHGVDALKTFIRERPTQIAELLVPGLPPGNETPNAVCGESKGGADECTSGETAEKGGVVYECVGGGWTD